MRFSRDILGSAILVVAGIERAWGQTILDTGSTLSMDGIYYYLPGKAFSHGHAGVYTAAAAGSKSSARGLIPVTVINSAAANFNLAAFESTVLDFGQQDDVWGENILSGDKPNRRIAVQVLFGSHVSSHNLEVIYTKLPVRIAMILQGGTIQGYSDATANVLNRTSTLATVQ